MTWVISQEIKEKQGQEVSNCPVLLESPLALTRAVWLY